MVGFRLLVEFELGEGRDVRVENDLVGRLLNLQHTLQQYRALRTERLFCCFSSSNRSRLVLSVLPCTGPFIGYEREIVHRDRG